MYIAINYKAYFDGFDEIEEEVPQEPQQLIEEQFLVAEGTDQVTES